MADSKQSIGPAMAMAVLVIASGCAEAPSVRTYDPYLASDEEVGIALAQLEDLARLQAHYDRERRLLLGGTALAVGIVLEAILLSRDACVPTTVLGVEVDDCATEAVLIGAAGGLVGAGFAELVIPLDAELHRGGLLAAEATTEDERRVKLDHVYRTFEAGEEDLDMGVFHQVGSGLLLGIGVAFLTLPVAIDDEDLDDYVIPGAISTGVGVLWGVLAGTLRDAPTFDLSVRPQGDSARVMLRLGAAF